MLFVLGVVDHTAQPVCVTLNCESRVAMMTH